METPVTAAGFLRACSEGRIGSREAIHGAGLQGFGSLLDATSPGNPLRTLSPEQAFETRMRAHEMEQFARDGYANAFIRTLFSQSSVVGRETRFPDEAFHPAPLAGVRSRPTACPGTPRSSRRPVEARQVPAVPERAAAVDRPPQTRYPDSRGHGRRLFAHRRSCLPLPPSGTARKRQGGKGSCIDSSLTSAPRHAVMARARRAARKQPVRATQTKASEGRESPGQFRSGYH